MSAESELGTLPVSVFELRALHTRSGLGRSAPYYAAPTAMMCLHGTRAPYPWDGVPLEVLLSPIACPRSPSESTATALLPHRPRSMPKTCIPRHAAPLGAEPTDPTLLGRKRASAVGKKGARTVLQD